MRQLGLARIAPSSGCTESKPPGDDAPATLAAEWRQRGSRIPLYNLPLAPGPDAIARAFDKDDFATAVPSFGNARQDLRRLIVRLSPEAHVLAFHRRVTRQGPPPHQGERRAPPHLALLQAHDEILALLAKRDDDASMAAARMAVQYQLVTPVTGAVVLETQQQYDQAGLQPVDPDSAPGMLAVPEPGAWGLMIVGALVLLEHGRRAGIRARGLRT